MPVKVPTTSPDDPALPPAAGQPPSFHAATLQLGRAESVRSLDPCEPEPSWCTPYDAYGLMKVLGVPAGWQVAAVIPFGFPRTPPSPAEAEDLDSRLHVDTW